MGQEQSPGTVDDSGPREWNGIPLPAGVYVRDDVVSIRFRYKGHQPRELNLPASAKTIKLAAQKLGAVQLDIQIGAFSYSKHFPNSPWCERFGEVNKVGRMFVTAAADYLKWARVKVGGQTFDTYRRVVDNKLVPRFGGKLVADINRPLLTDYIMELGMTTDEEGDFYYCLKTIRNILTPLRNILDREADTEHSIQSNPADGIKIDKFLPKAVCEYEKPPPHPYDFQERAALIALADPHIKQLLNIWAGTGLRAQEIFALQWSEIDEKAGHLFVCRVVDGNGQIRNSTKTIEGRRYVKLDAGVTDVRGALKRQRELTGDRKDGFVFINPVTGERWNKVGTIANSQWTTLCGAAGVEYRGPNQMRHTYASERITRGDSAWDIAPQMGHKNPEMLYRHYGKMLEKAAPEVAKKLRAHLRLVA